ncbi:MAG: UDP-diphosphatase, partial [Fervidobacterium sp.]
LLQLKYITLTPAIISGFGGAVVAGLSALWLVKALTLSAHLKFFSIYLLLPAILSFLLNFIK